MATSFFSSPPAKILVVTLRYLGDTLLVTALLNSLKQAYPQAQIDVLLYENTAAILAGNPAVANLITTVTKPRWQDHKKLVEQIFRRYDLAINPQTNDKSTLYTLLASRKTIGFVPKKSETGWFKRYLYTRWLEFDTQKTHTVLELLRLCQLLEIAPVYHLTAPQPDLSGLKNLEALKLPNHYVVLHPMPQWRYKQWTQKGWEAVAAYCHAQGFGVILSGGAAKVELDYLEKLQLPKDTLNLAGKLSLAELATIIAKATMFIGVDTGITHLATATGVTTIALFGPSDPVKWTPWPMNYESNKPPFVSHGNQHVNNVYLIQGQKECVPCYLEGCERNQQSYSTCLDELKPEQVIAVLESILLKQSNT